MRKSSWIALVISGVLLVGLGATYLLGQIKPSRITQQSVETMLRDMQHAVRHKDVDGIMQYIDPTPGKTIAHLKAGQIRSLLSNAFHAMGTPEADVSQISFQREGDHAVVGFDLRVHSGGPDYTADDDYQGHITLVMKKVSVSRLMGLYHSKEWLIVDGSTTGPDPQYFGDY